MSACVSLRLRDAHDSLEASIAPLSKSCKGGQHKGGEERGAIVIAHAADVKPIFKSKQAPPEQLLHALLDPL